MTRAKAETTVSQFYRWQARFEEEPNRPTKEDWYAAQTAFLIHEIPFRVFGKTSKAKIEDFLLKFDTGQKKLPDRPLTPEEAKARMEMSKAFWRTMKKAAEAAGKKPAKKPLKPPKKLGRDRRDRGGR